MIRRRFHMNAQESAIVLEGLRLEGEPFRVTLGVNVPQGRQVELRIQESQDRVNWCEIGRSNFFCGVSTWCVAAACRWIRVFLETGWGAKAEGEIVAEGIRDSGEARDAS